MENVELILNNANQIRDEILQVLKQISSKKIQFIDLIPWISCEISTLERRYDVAFNKFLSWEIMFSNEALKIPPRLQFNDDA